jgi:exonuclease SbcC
MRLHLLEATAFGPFADEVAVDFDALSDAGLFLLSGATGAGKTSVLDAVCFALYGEVPGDRQAAKRLRSDHAAEGVRPVVTLEVTLSGRRFRIVRSPAWERPKKRGSGVTTEQASVRLSERRDGSWHQLSHRLDETGHLVTHLVGMNLAQFCQVAMLPQGRFQAFLRARSDERHQLLQQLFRTTRFEDIERWLRERRRALRQRSVGHHKVVADLVSRVSETADAPLPEAWDPHDLTLPADNGEVLHWSALQRERAAASGAETADLVRLTADAEARARAALDQARRLVELQSTHAEAMATHDRLRAQGSEHAARRQRLSAARRAAAVRPLHELAVRQQRACAAALALRTTRTHAVAGLLGVDVAALDATTLAASGQAAVDAAARTRALLPREETLESLRRTARDTEARILELQTKEATTSEQLGALPAELTRLQAAHTEAKAALLAVPAAKARAEELRRRRRAAEQVLVLTKELVEARELHTAAVDELHRRKEAWLHLQQERINGMAAELAGALAAGDDCPVCGSAEHPRLASARTGAPDSAAEKAARRLVDDAESARLAHDGRVRDLLTRIAVAEDHAAGDGDPTRELAAAESEVARLSTAADTVTGLAADIERVATVLTRLTESREALLLELATARAGLDAQRAQADAISRELGEVLDDTGHPSLADLAREHDALAAACDEALTAWRDLDRAAEAEADAWQRAGSAATDAGFPSLDAALEAFLGRDDTAALEELIRVHEAELAKTEGVLADPGLRAAAAVKAPDVPQLEMEHQQCGDALGAARAAAAVAKNRAQRLAGLDSELRGALEEWAPVRADLDLATRMAALADGTSPDNRLQMRLSGYVLAWRLAQVVAAANERLARMSDQRYSLEHTGRRGAGETRGGLSLLVRDDWSGETRDPATLSGGETFVVSLALALGLADVIAHEVGGADLDTLFVDEGFGSLDADTLDDVMDTLDTLRDGGRVVGVVSHVAEMRDRIPTQLRVTKSRSGSTVAICR